MLDIESDVEVRRPIATRTATRVQLRHLVCATPRLRSFHGDLERLQHRGAQFERLAPGLRDGLLCRRHHDSCARHTSPAHRWLPRSRICLPRSNSRLHRQHDPARLAADLARNARSGAVAQGLRRAQISGLARTDSDRSLPSSIPRTRWYSSGRDGTRWTPGPAQWHEVGRVGTGWTIGPDHPDLRRHQPDPTHGHQQEARSVRVSHPARVVRCCPARVPSLVAVLVSHPAVGASWPADWDTPTRR